MSAKIAGDTISRYLQNLLKTKHPKIINKQFAKHLNRIKVSKCFLSLDFENDLKNKDLINEITENVEIPMFMETITLSIKKILAPEIIFRPFLANLTEPGIEDLFSQSIQETHPSQRQLLYKDVILIGGTTKFPNFTERFMDQFEKIPLLAQTKIHHDPDNADLISWIGMKKFCEQDLYEAKAITQTNFFAKL